MVNKITKSLGIDFGNNLNTSQLMKEINDSGLIAANCVSVISILNTVDIYFDNNINETEISFLNTIISNHDPNNQKKKVEFISVQPKIYSVTSNMYYKVATFQYEGTNNMPTIDFIDVVSKMDVGIDSYSIRIVDQHNNILAQANFANTELNSNSLGLISNIPNTKSLLDIHVRKNGGLSHHKVYIDSFNFYFN